MEKSKTHKTILWAILVILTSVLLGQFTTLEYVKARGIDYLDRGNQIERHRSIMEGNAGNPWQYRILAPYLLERWMRLFESAGFPRYIALSFITFRFLQDMLVLLFSYFYYRSLRFSRSQALMGMSVLAWSMSYSHYDSDLSFNTFFDVIFYLLSGICIVRGYFILIAPITLFAALNRETSALIPFLLFFHSFIQKKSLNSAIVLSLSSFTIYIVAFNGLMLFYGDQELIIPYGYKPGFELLKYNLLREVTWQQMIITMNIIPLISIISYYRWNISLKIFFWVIVPIWFIVHAFSAVMAETRLFLVPQAMIFIPGALYCFVRQEHVSDRAREDM